MEKLFPREIKTTRKFRNELLGDTSKWNEVIEFIFLKFRVFKLGSDKKGYSKYHIRCELNLLGKLVSLLVFPILLLIEGLREFRYCWDITKNDLVDGEMWSVYKYIKNK